MIRPRSWVVGRRCQRRRWNQAGAGSAAGAGAGKAAHRGSWGWGVPSPPSVWGNVEDGDIRTNRQSVPCGCGKWAHGAPWERPESEPRGPGAPEPETCSDLHLGDTGVQRHNGRAAPPQGEGWTGRRRRGFCGGEAGREGGRENERRGEKGPEGGGEAGRGGREGRKRSSRGCPSGDRDAPATCGEAGRGTKQCSSTQGGGWPPP